MKKFIGGCLTAALAALVFASSALATAKRGEFSEYSEFGICPEADNADDRNTRHLTTSWLEAKSSSSGLLCRDLERTEVVAPTISLLVSQWFEGIALTIRALVAEPIVGSPTIENPVVGGVKTASDQETRGSDSAWWPRLTTLKAEAAARQVSGRKELVPHVAVMAIPGCA
jgi:hypothetical protein